MFPDLSALAEMLREPMKEYVTRNGYTTITIEGEPTRDETKPHIVSVNTTKLNSSDEIAEFIINAFVEMTNGDSTND